MNVLSRLDSIRTTSRWSVLLLLTVGCVLGESTGEAQEDQTVSLFDGQTLQGWHVRKPEQSWWRAENGAITGGSLTRRVPRNTFVCTNESFQNFDLRLKIRIRGNGGFINSGIQIRSVRVPNSHEMRGYQVDVGDGWWGKLYDESRRKRVIATAANLPAVEQAIRKDDWNEFRILAQGSRIQTWINGVTAIDYTETDPQIPQTGRLGIQVHGAGKALVEVKEITLKRLPATPDRPAEKDTPKNQSQADTSSRTPEQERRGFRVPEGFEVELVASETADVGKFVALAFDAQGRLWTMTALEYPVDANENPEASRRLFAQGGRDQVLVIDRPFGKQPSKPRTFAKGLVMPLGILPYRDGAYVQYGHDIRFYRDTNGDGQADRHEVVLTGFGVQDSHLFPHQFTRVPGGSILLAQGLYNYSQVRRPDGQPFADGSKEVRFSQCKLARFSPDGSMFELLTTGPNNIWGLTVSREGETWLQEANDLGYPIIPFEPGQRYKTPSRDRLRPYQPLMPPTLAPPQLGGTGLSGLALADDRNGWPAPWGFKNASATGPRVFYVANPITSRIQMIQATPQGNGHASYQLLPDFLTSDDPYFRPVAIQFGPDGCLYVVDWYNKIISHNEVPRNHPDRDKTRGRIWRIRHASQSHTTPPDLTRLSDRALLEYLGDDNARLADLAWQQLADRRPTHLVPTLTQLAKDAQLLADRRLGALWVLEAITTVPTDLLVTLVQDPHANLRREAIRIAAAQPRSAAEFLAIAERAVDDSSPRVRAALGDGLRRVRDVDAQVVALMLRLGQAPLTGEAWAVYDRQFERYLARWAMERNRAAVAKFLKSPAGLAMPVENRLLAVQALDAAEAAIALARLVPELQRPLSQDELRVLVAQANEPSVAAVIQTALEQTDSRIITLQTLLALRTETDLTRLHETIAQAVLTLWNDDRSDVGRRLALQATAEFRLRPLEGHIAGLLVDPQQDRRLKLTALKALGELGVSQPSALVAVVRNGSDHEIRSQALSALTNSTAEEVLAALVGLLPDLDYQQRTAAIEHLATHRPGAQTILEVIDSGDLDPEDLPISTLMSMRELLPEDPAMKVLWDEVTERFGRTLRLPGGANDYAASSITLRGPFTVEAWVRLAPGIGSQDGILGRRGVFDLNFSAQRFRVWIASQGDIVVAQSPATPEVWTHYAVTRDATSNFRIYINGELNAQSQHTDVADLVDLNIGRTSPDAGTDGHLAEFRVWNVARSEAEIRDHFDQAFSPSADPPGLTHHFAGAEWGPLSGNARVQPTLDLPRLLTAEQAQQQADKFARFRELAQQPGRLAQGQQVFTKQCLICHEQGGQGAKIGPPLDGLGLKSTEALLRNILTPSAAMEGGYRNYRVLTRNGRIVQGLLVSDDGQAVVLRQPNLPDQRIAHTNIQRAGYTTVSIMPEGLLEALSSEQVRDLFTYLRSLRQGRSRTP